jgi:hypothetical protein
MLSWDHGQMDRNLHRTIQLWMFWGGSNPNNRPALLALHVDNPKVGAIVELENQSNASLTTLTMDPRVIDRMTAAIPNMFGMTQEQTDLTPPMIHDLKYGGRIEMGDPICGRNRFNLTLCPARKHMQFWHPEFKQLALSGNLLALFLTEVLEDAIQDLKSRYPGQNDEAAIQSELERLHKLQEKDYQSYVASEC